MTNHAATYLSTLAAYTATYEPDPDLFRAAFALADRLGGTLGLTAIGRLVITLTPTEDNPRPAIRAAGAISAEDFPYCYVEPGTDTVLTFSF